MQNPRVIEQITPLLPWLLAALVTFALLVSLRRKPKASFYSVLVAALIWGCALFLVVPPFFNAEFSHSLGDAFVIAALLSATVDQYVKGRVLHEVTDDISKYLIGYRLPEQLQDRIRAIMQTRWILRDFEVRIRFRTINARSLEVDVNRSERVQNISSETQQYEDCIVFSKLERKRVIELRCDSDSSEDTYHFDEQSVLHVEESGQIRHVGRSVKVPPASDTERDFQFSKRYVAPHSFSSKEVFTFTQTTIGASIQVIDAPEGVIFHLTPAPDQSAHLRWTYNRLFLPGEQIAIQWERQVEVGL